MEYNATTEPQKPFWTYQNNTVLIRCWEDMPIPEMLETRNVVNYNLQYGEYLDEAESKRVHKECVENFIAIILQKLGKGAKVTTLVTTKTSIPHSVLLFHDFDGCLQVSIVISQETPEVSYWHVAYYEVNL